MGVVIECMEDCRNAAVEAQFPAECGSEMLHGCLQDLAQAWSQQQFEIWFTDMETKYGQYSPSGISLSCLYRNITQLLNTWDLPLNTELN